MGSLETLAERAVAEPVAGPTPMRSLRERSRRHERSVRFRRAALVLAVAVPLVVVVGLLAFRPSTVRIDTADGGMAEVSDVFGARLADDGAVWPAEPLPLDRLLDEVATRMLGWPVVEWDRSDLDDAEGGVTATQPGHPDRRVAISVRESESGGWQIVSMYPSLRMLSTDGSLTGFAFDGSFAPGVPADSVRVEVFHLDPIDGSQTRTILTDGVAGASSVTLVEPIPAERAGTFLVVARDAAGEATAMSGLSIGSPDRLTVDIESLLGAGAPASLPDDVVARAADGPWASPIDLDRSVMISGIVEGVDLFVVPFVDDSGVAFYEFAAADGSWGSGGGDALWFNRNGYVTSSYDRDESDGHTLIVLPDSLEFSPELATKAVAGGRVVVLPYVDDVERLIVVDGVMTLRP